MPLAWLPTLKLSTLNISRHMNRRHSFLQLYLPSVLIGHDEAARWHDAGGHDTRDWPGAALPRMSVRRPPRAWDVVAMRSTENWYSERI
jgi:hypothetical protein